MADIALLSGYRAKMGVGPVRDAELRRLALQLAVQLPESPDEGLMVIEHMKTLVRSFLGDLRPV